MFKVNRVCVQNATVFITIERKSSTPFIIDLLSRDKASNSHRIPYTLHEATRSISFPITEDALDSINHMVYLLPRNPASPQNALHDAVPVEIPHGASIAPSRVHLVPPAAAAMIRKPTSTTSIHRTLLDIAFACIDHIITIQNLHTHLQRPFTDATYKHIADELVKTACSVPDGIIASSISVSINLKASVPTMAKKPFQGWPSAPIDLAHGPPDSPIHREIINLIKTYTQWYEAIIALFPIVAPEHFHDRAYRTIQARVTPLLATSAPHTPHALASKFADNIFNLLLT